MSKRRNSRRRELHRESHTLTMTAKQNNLTYDELSEQFRKVVRQMAAAYTWAGADEDTATVAATEQFVWGARVLGVWPAIYAECRAGKVSG